MKQPKRTRLSSEPANTLHLTGFMAAINNIEQAAGEVTEGLKRAAESVRPVFEKAGHA